MPHKPLSRTDVYRKYNKLNHTRNNLYYNYYQYNIYKYNKWGFDIYGYNYNGFNIYGYNRYGYKRQSLISTSKYSNIQKHNITKHISKTNTNITKNILKTNSNIPIANTINTPVMGCNTDFTKSSNVIKYPIFNSSMISSLLGIDIPSKINEPDDMVDETVDMVDDSDYEYKCLDKEVNTLQDLIDLGILYNTEYKGKEYRFNIDIGTISRMLIPLTELNNMVGLDSIKNEIVEQILFHLQKLDNGNNDMLHTVIYGPPGVGKTEIAKLLGQIYKNMNILSKGTIRSVKRADLVGRYLGETSIKTKQVLDECKGGVLFIDEAYSLGNPEQRDSFSRECIDCITSFLTENKKDFMCIIAGYKQSLDKCFFSYNEGLRSRFPVKYEIKSYSPIELRDIFKKMILDNNWFITDNTVSDTFFVENKDIFKYNGRDMEVLLNKVKIAHAKRVLCLEQDVKKIITAEDLSKGFELYKTNLPTKAASVLHNMYL
jgi:AAA+ superfamily predicted ATPase